MWFSRNSGRTWQDRGLQCVSFSGVRDQSPSGQAVHEVFTRAVPTASISTQPHQGLLPQVPTLFSSGQPQQPDTSTHRIGSLQVRLSPVARWQWDFGDGAVLDTSAAGSRFPDRLVSHTYRSAGVYEVRLTTIWTATYTVDGQGPFTVEGTVTQSTSTRIVVGQGRAVLS